MGRAGPKDTARTAGQLQKRARQARTERVALRLNNALEYEIVIRALELLRLTLACPPVVGEAGEE